MKQLTAIEQVQEARTRLNKAQQALKFDMDCLRESEVKFRLTTIADMILIVQSDLRQMEAEWEMEMIASGVRP